jgi:hypothetical protein
MCSEGLWHKRNGSCEIWEFFWIVWSGSGPICNYFLEADGPAINFPNAQGPQHNLHQA